MIFPLAYHGSRTDCWPHKRRFELDPTTRGQPLAAVQNKIKTRNFHPKHYSSSSSSSRLFYLGSLVMK